MNAAATTLDPARFRDAMSRLAAGVTVVTTRTRDGARHGFTATSFCSVSGRPPLVLVCLATDAGCHDAFGTSERFAVSVLSADHAQIAQTFATHGADKFGDDAGFTETPSGLPAIADALTVVDATVVQRCAAGDHTILLGEVTDVVTRPGAPSVYYDRRFGQFSASTSEGMP